MNWSIQKIWNESVQFKKAEPKKRDYISASDIGGSYLDRYYKMKGVPETNPREPRVLRLFAAGETFHYLMRRTFKRIGILLEAEHKITIERIVPVIGYFDCKLGGKVNLKQAYEALDNDEDLPEFFKEKGKKIAKYFASKYPKGFSPVVCEIKSVHSRSFWSFVETGGGYLKEAYPHHQLQLYTYLKGLDMKEGRILYISKDDLTLAEHTVKNPTARLEEKWKADIKLMTRYFTENIKPEREPDLGQNEKGKWVPNWRIERSPYLTKITGFKNKDAWLKFVKNKARELNKKVVNKKK